MAEQAFLTSIVERGDRLRYREADGLGVWKFAGGYFVGRAGDSARDWRSFTTLRAADRWWAREPTRLAGALPAQVAQRLYPAGLPCGHTPAEHAALDADPTALPFC